MTSPPRIPSSDRTATTAFAAILALTVFRWVTLTESHLNLQFDEAQYWDWSRHVAFGYVSKPPMIAWVIGLTTHLFGDSEAAIRAAAPMLHAATAFALYALGTRMFNRLTGFWAGLTYATLPSVSYSSLIISTDAVLLPFWTLALGLYWSICQGQGGKGRAAGLGLCIGAGLLAKYAMVYFILGMAVHIALSRDARRARRYLPIAASVALLTIAPNLIWNVLNGWATFSHTADNADWQGSRKGGFGPLLEFLAGQIGIVGPVPAALALWLGLRNRTVRDTRMLFLACFSLPVLLIVIVQSLIAGAHINWAAPAYVALVLAVCAWAVQRAQILLGISLIVNMAVLVLCCFLFAGFVPPNAMPRNTDVFAKLRGWDKTAQLIDGVMATRPDYSLLFDERKFAVLFNYYLRDKPYHIVIWPFMGKRHSQFAMTNSVDLQTGKKTILVSRWHEPGVEHTFLHVQPLETFTQRLGQNDIRTFHVWKCEDLLQAP